MINFLSEVQKRSGYTREKRRDFHKNPELGFLEYRTADIVSRELNLWGYEVSTGIADTGIHGVLESKTPGPNVLLRFDMDALPIQEENDVPYASIVPNVMHACGHDGHVAIGLTVAELLSKFQTDIQGTYHLIFQPGEEGLGGAKRMIEEGVLQSMNAKYSLGVHLWNEKPVGWFGLASGPVMAGSDRFEINITGRGGHGAIPDKTNDPVVIAVQLISMLQTIVSRNVSPLESAALSIGQIVAGDTYNVIPQRLFIKGTLRTFKPDIRRMVIERIQSIIEGLQISYRCDIAFELKPLTPPVNNDKYVTQIVKNIIKRQLPEVEIDEAYQTMVSEDMSLFLQEVPGCFILVGSANSASGKNFSHHNPRFDFDESALTNAVIAVLSSAVELTKN